MMQYSDFDDQNKANNNKKLCNYIQKLKQVGNVLILDGPLQHTTTALVRIGIAERNIFIPEINKETFILHKNYNCQAYHGTLYDMLKHKHFSNKLKMFNVAYFDYMGTITGNKEKTIFPLEDISFFLSQCADEIVVAFTFCLRTTRGLFGDRDSSFEQTKKDYIEPIIKYHQFRIKKSYATIYNRKKKGGKKSAAMSFYLYLLKKDKRINPSTVDFIIDSSGDYDGYRS